MVRQDFLFVAGIPALDFLNTEIMSAGERVDLLDSAEALARWTVEAGLMERRAVARPRTLAEARELRATVREICGRMADGKPPADAAVARLNGFLGRARGRCELQGSRVAFVTDGPWRDDPVWNIARSAAEFLADADPSLVRRCKGTGCILFFYDQTKSHNRRWCSMAVCGNRMKAATFYARSKGGG